MHGLKYGLQTRLRSGDGLQEAGEENEGGAWRIPQQQCLQKHTLTATTRHFYSMERPWMMKIREWNWKKVVREKKGRVQKRWWEDEESRNYWHSYTKVTILTLGRRVCSLGCLNPCVRIPQRPAIVLSIKIYIFALWFFALLRIVAWLVAKPKIKIK